MKYAARLNRLERRRVSPVGFEVWFSNDEGATWTNREIGELTAQALKVRAKTVNRHFIEVLYTTQWRNGQ